MSATHGLTVSDVTAIADIVASVATAAESHGRPAGRLGVSLTADDSGVTVRVTDRAPTRPAPLVVPTTARRRATAFGWSRSGDGIDQAWVTLRRVEPCEPPEVPDRTGPPPLRRCGDAGVRWKASPAPHDDRNAT